MKFKVGNLVRLTRELIYIKIKQRSPLDDLDINGFIITKIENGTIYREDNKRYGQGELELVPEEPEFEYGEEIEVRDFTDRKWRKGIFVCKIPGPVSYKFLIVNPHQEKEFKEGLEFTTVNWKYARKRKNELKRSAVAKKFGVSEDFILVD